MAFDLIKVCKYFQAAIIGIYFLYSVTSGHEMLLSFPQNKKHICQPAYLTKLLFIIDVAKAPQYDHHHLLAEANGNVRAACLQKPGWK